MAREPDDTRNLPVGNCDSKLIASAHIKPVSDFAADFIIPTQRGFVRDRHMVWNICDIDAHSLAARILATFPAAIFWDFKNAFPSIAHAFLWLTLSIGV